MNQEKIGKIIKEIRKKNGLTQEKFATKYGVTYQAVSKWENGKNIPDITILKTICDDYQIDINDLLDGTPTEFKDKEISKTKKNKIIIIGIITILLIIILCFSLLIIFNKNHNDFSFNTLSTSCDDFNLFGSIAYNNNKTSIYISNITYCGDKDENKYKEIKCILYEENDQVKSKISSYTYSDDESITLSDFLTQVNFNVDHYSKTCTMYKEDTLLLEIEATDENNQITFYKIPLELNEQCGELFSTES